MAEKEKTTKGKEAKRAAADKKPAPKPRGRPPKAKK
jgi:hypothetical protein